MSQNKKLNTLLIFQQTIVDKIFTNVKMQNNLSDIRSGTEVIRSLTFLAQHIAFSLIMFMYETCLEKNLASFNYRTFLDNSSSLSKSYMYPLFASVVSSASQSDYSEYVTVNKAQKNNSANKVLSFYNSILNLSKKTKANNEDYSKISIDSNMLYIISYITVKSIRNLAFASLSIITLNGTRTVTYDIILNLVMNKFVEYERSSFFRDFKKLIYEAVMTKQKDEVDDAHDTHDTHETHDANDAHESHDTHSTNGTLELPEVKQVVETVAVAN